MVENGVLTVSSRERDRLQPIKRINNGTMTDKQSDEGDHITG